MAAMSTARERPTYDSMSKTGIDRVNSYDTVGHISMTTPYVALPTLDYGSAWPFGSGSGRVTGQWVWTISASRPGHRIQRADHRAVADHPVAVDEEDPLLQRGHGVVVEPADEIAIHHVEPRAAQLRAGVAVGERVGEAHHRRASGLEGRRDRPARRPRRAACRDRRRRDRASGCDRRRPARPGADWG